MATRDVLRSLSPAARLAAGLLAVLLVAGLGLLVRQQAASSHSYLLAGRSFTPSELVRVEAALAKAGLSDWEYHGQRIRIPRARQAEYVAALVDGGALPADLESPLELKAQDALSPFAGRAQADRAMKLALQQKLALILRSMQGIESAVVTYDSHSRGGLRREEVMTASVGVRTLPDHPLDDQRVQGIRHLVAGSIAGMAPQDVIVADLSSGRVWAGDETAAAAAGDPYLQQVREHEENWRRKIREALSYVPEAAVAVHVELGTRPAAGTAPAASPQVTVSIGIPERYFQQLYTQQVHNALRGAPRPTPDSVAQAEMEKIRRHVAALLPPGADDQQRLQCVQVTRFAAVVEPSAAVARSRREIVLSWLAESWTTVVLLGLAGVALWLLRSFARPVPRTAANLAGASRLDEPHALSGPHGMSEPDLVRVVRDDPAAAAAVLRQWIAHASDE